MKKLINLIKFIFILSLFSFTNIFSTKEDKCLRNYGWCSNIAEMELIYEISEAIDEKSEKKLKTAEDAYVRSIDTCINELDTCAKR